MSVASRSNKLDYALHNEEACNYVNQSDEFNDWIVTTAFYSAIHFVEHALFPQSYEDPATGSVKRFHNFNEYCKSIRNSSASFRDKHSIRQDLVEDVYPEFIDDYTTLSDNCTKARYYNYNISPDVAKLCRICLQNIKELCCDS